MEMRAYAIKSTLGARVSYFYGSEPGDALWHKTITYEREMPTLFVSSFVARQFARRMAGLQKNRKNLKVIRIIALVEERA